MHQRLARKIRGEVEWIGQKMKTEGRLAARRRRANEKLRVPIARYLAHFKSRSGGIDLDQRDGGGRGSDRSRGVHHDAEGTMIGVAGDRMFVRYLCHGQQGKQGQAQHRHRGKGAWPCAVIISRACLECGEQTVL